MKRDVDFLVACAIVAMAMGALAHALWPAKPPLLVDARVDGAAHPSQPGRRTSADISVPPAICNPPAPVVRPSPLDVEGWNPV